jgi:hypothetical protein
MGKRWLLSWMRCGVVLPLSFPDNSGIRYSTQAWLSKAADIVEGDGGDIGGYKVNNWKETCGSRSLLLC